MRTSVACPGVSVDVFLVTILKPAHRQSGAYGFLRGQLWVPLQLAFRRDDVFPFQNPSSVDDVPSLIPPFAAEAFELAPRLEFKQARLLHMFPIGVNIVRGEQVVVSFNNGTSGAILRNAFEHKLLVFPEIARLAESCSDSVRNPEFTLGVAFRFFNEERLRRVFYW